MFYLGAIAESRDAADEALQIYSRVTGGDLAMAAQSRAARLKARKDGVTKGLEHLEEFASTRPQYALDVIAARATLLASSGDKNGALALLDTSLKEYPDSSELRFARVFQLEDADRVDESIKELRKLVADRPRRSRRLECTRLHARRPHQQDPRGAEADSRCAGADARQRRGARQHGLGTASRKTQ